MDDRPTFDAAKFKTTTRAQWQSAADAWHQWGPFLGEWLGPATEQMFDLAYIKAGSRVLDVAAGAGEQSIAAARRVGPGGHVLATDIAPALLDHARADARAAGLSNVETRELDGEALSELPAASFDAAISRVGLIYFPDQQRALAGIRSALKPGGRFAAIVYSTPENNQFFSIPVGIIRRRAKLPPPQPGQPGPFSLGGDGVLAAAYERAGLRDIEVRKVESPVRLPSTAECVRFERESFGALHQMMSTLSDAERAETWDEIEHELRQFETNGRFVGPCEMVVGAGTA
ncbi:MAG: methyltransferase domain-containing protein [Pseudomonadota bacterium]|nr:methyltransferase domain-containing protein [Pseudomonadota bacterium]